VKEGSLVTGVVIGTHLVPVVRSINDMCEFVAYRYIHEFPALELYHFTDLLNVLQQLLLYVFI